MVAKPNCALIEPSNAINNYFEGNKTVLNRAARISLRQTLVCALEWSLYSRGLSETLGEMREYLSPQVETLAIQTKEDIWSRCASSTTRWADLPDDSD